MSGKVKNNNTIVFIVRDFSVGGINTVTSQVINSILKKGKYNIVLISLSKKNKQISYFDHLDNVHYLTDIVDGYVGIIARLINRFFPFLGSKIFSKYFNKILSEKIESLDSVYKVFLCGFGVYSNFSKVDDNRVFYISHNIKSMLLKNRSSFFYSLNINRLKEIVPEDRLITVSKAIKLDWVNNIFNGDNKDSKIRVVYNPIDSEYITAKSKEENKILKAHLNIDDGYFLFCGRLAREKNVLNIVKAWHRAHSKSKLVIAGDGVERQDIQKYILQNGINKDVIMLGRVDNPYPLIKGAKALLLFSDYEGLPTVILEAICLETQVILNECGGAAYDVIPKEYWFNIIKDNNIKLLEDRIADIEKNGPNIYPFDYDKYDENEVADRYVKL